ncbi:adenosylhomocysteine nucleosidase [Thermoanaerobacter thermohydrosulfuricus]|uniref:adenosylhomocysteine nucleosidase n=2 Tax=Thermoanaerobacter thermohydrosulfuricus TaxID=1516 RepID=M8CNW2_THETY|nr:MULTISPECIES: 5'-methylthioadenosine/adenosylhomocysteine nucleosidase [Thermoanaerobacter]EMT38805.1 5''-methylthioadenosine/S-adenosylhomocysteine nucleosidase [Thermoanaerobacter thermohydrosulfuricus WC1]SDG06424.1 adenosylhomocysteine nucleosidase [Thermoanaerobacter thermohydrosulfuricus]SFE21557.1 adenosylhomocysteine nucleosidase [Thermoanaerobacter thermohydrosulfuricus]
MKKIGLIGAMEEEVNILKDEMTLKEIVKKAKLDFYVGSLKGADIVIVRSGIGKVNAAMATQILVSDFNVDVLINTGVAGGIKPDIKVGDIVISSDTMEYDIDVTAFGYEPGIIPRMEESIFKADEKLVELAKKVAKNIVEGRAYVGRIISGDKFVSSKEEAKRLGKVFNAYAVEMEGAAIAHVAFLNSIPFVIIRSISDNANEEASIDFNTFIEQAAKSSTKIVSEMVKLL